MREIQGAAAKAAALNQIFEGVKARKHGAERKARPDNDGEDIAQPLEEA